MLYLVGLGLGDAKDITIKGLEIVKSASKVYLEAYTSILGVNTEELEAFYGREVVIADRELIEQDVNSMLSEAKQENIALLVVGDPFGATTHTDLVLRCVQLDIPYKVIHNASIMNAVGCCGLQLYNFGETVSIVFWTSDWKPDSFYDRIARNRRYGLHTLCLLDIKVKEQTIENLMKGRKIYDPPRFMSVQCAANQLLEIIDNKRRSGTLEKDLAYLENTICVGLARVGSDDQEIVSGSLQQMASVDLGKPLHSLIISGHLHPLECDMLKLFAVDTQWFEEAVVPFSA